MKVTVAGRTSGQLLKDIVAKTVKQGDKRVWVFADDAMEALKASIRSGDY